MVRYKVVLEYSEGYYTVTVPALPGCVTQGRTKEETLEHANIFKSLFSDFIFDFIMTSFVAF